MTARTLYALPGPLTLTPSQRNRQGRFAVTNREPSCQITIGLVDVDGHDTIVLDRPGDRASWPTEGVRAMSIGADHYPASILLESTELPIELDTALIIGNAATDPVFVHVTGGGGGGIVTVPSWDFINGIIARAALTMTVGHDDGHRPNYHIVIKFPSGAIAATYSWTTSTGFSTLGDGTGIDDFGAQGPLVLVDGLLYSIWATVDVNLVEIPVGYTNGLANIFDTSSDWPAGVSVTQVPVAPQAGVAMGSPFLIGTFTAHVP
jgi:hypothetical protein